MTDLADPLQPPHATAPAPTVAVQVQDAPARERFEACLLDGTVIGLVEYRRDGDSIALTHTEVDPAYEGRGVAAALARAALDAARAAGLGVLPYCPFIAAYLRRHPGDLDLVPAAVRGAFRLPTTAAAGDAEGR